MQAAERKTSVTVEKPLVAAIASGLVEEACWFQVMPLPFDHFEIFVHCSMGASLDRIVKDARGSNPAKY